MNRTLLEKDILYLGHWQQHSDHRANYLPGLAVAVAEEWGKEAEGVPTDRNLHYLARELVYTGRPRSAIKLFEKHIALNRWPAERAESLVLMGDCYGKIGDEQKQLECYHRAFHTSTARRVALLRLAHFYRAKGEWRASMCFATAALEIPWHGGFYAENKQEYAEIPHVLIYTAAGWQGDIPKAQAHLKKVLEFSPHHPEACRDAQFYFGYDIAQAPEGWMLPAELLHLYESAQGKQRIIEVGSWKGRSTHALCSGAAKTGGIVWAVDHFRGSADGRDLTHGADPDEVYKAFTQNTKQFENLFVHRADSLEAAKSFPDGYADLLFIDGEHTEDACRADIMAWARKVKDGGILCGHDYDPRTWPGVVAAVDGIFGKPDGVCHSIWHKKLEGLPINPLLGYLTQMVREGRPTSFIKRGDGEEACLRGEQGANCDSHPYTPELAQNLKMAFWSLEKMAADRREGRTRVNVVPFKDQAYYNILLARHDNNLDAVKSFWGAVRESDKRKIFVGPERLRPAARMLRAEHVVIPSANCFNQYASVRGQLFERLKPGAVFLFCASMMAKVFIAELLCAEPNTSCIDCGSALDPIFVGQTRTEQLPMDLLLLEYKDWLEQ